MQLESLTPIAADGQHNAFTSLIHWQDRYWLAYRQAFSHAILPTGRIIVQTSPDGQTWTALPPLQTGGDDRDPKFFSPSGASLYLHWGSYLMAEFPAAQTVAGTQCFLLSHLAAWHTTPQTWSPPIPFGRLNYWVWSIVALPHLREPWGAAAYHVGSPGDTTSTALFLSTEKTRDEAYVYGTPAWRWHSHLYGQYMDAVSEPVVWLEDSQLYCLLRQERHGALLGRSEWGDKSFHTEALAGVPSWTWVQLPVVLHSAAVLPYDGNTYIAGRARYTQLPPEGKRAWRQGDMTETTHLWRTSLFLLDKKTATLHHQLTLPSDGDTGYPGLAPGPRPETLLCSYYSQHEYPRDPCGWHRLLHPHPASVYIAELRV